METLLDYKKILKSQSLKANTWTNPSIILLDFLLLGLSVLMTKVNTPLGILGCIAMSIVIFHSFSLFHDAVHGSLFKNKKANEVAGLLLGSICFLPYNLWKIDHLDHHKWAGNIRKDPVMKLVRNVREGKYPNSLVTLIWNSWIPILGISQYCLFWFNAFFNLLKHFSLRNLISLIIPLVVVSCFIWVVSPIYFFLTSLLYFLMVEFINFPHHLGTHYLHRDRLPTWKQDLVSRTCLFPKWFSWGIALNFNYHAEHHQFPHVPWYRLHLINDLTNNKRKFTCKNFEWAFRNRRLAIEEVIHEYKND